MSGFWRDPILPAVLAGVVLAATLAFTWFAYGRSKTDARWCAWFGGAAVPEHCRAPLHLRHCLQWSEP